MLRGELFHISPYNDYDVTGDIYTVNVISLYTKTEPFFCIQVFISCCWVLHAIKTLFVVRLGWALGCKSRWVNGGPTTCSLTPSCGDTAVVGSCSSPCSAANSCGAGWTSWTSRPLFSPAVSCICLKVLSFRCARIGVVEELVY